MTRRLQHDQLIATDAGASIGERRYALRAHRYGGTPKIEHDKIIAEPVHFEERDLAHGAAYMVEAGPVQRRGTARQSGAGAVHQASGSGVVPGSATG